MTQVGQKYRCDICGNIVEIKTAGAGELVCCAEPMELMNENQKVDSEQEKVEEKDED